MTLERDFALLSTQVQERIMGMLETGKPVRTPTQTLLEGAAGGPSAKPVPREKRLLTSEHETDPGRLHRRRHTHAHRPVGPRLLPQHRPDDLLVAAIRSALKQVPSLDPKAIEDAIVGCAIPRASRA